MEKKYYALYLIPSRADFAQTMTEDERAIMMRHVAYWTEIMEQGKVIAFGPVLDPQEVYGLGIISAENEQEVRDFIAKDPAAKINKYEYYPMMATTPRINK